MNSRCPYCGEPLYGNDLIPPMNKRRRRIYDAVAEAGTKGVGVNTLLSVYSDGHKPTPSAKSVLRVQIHELNRDIKQIHQKIAAVDGSYYLFPTEE